MKALLLTLGWTLRASALICVTWIVVQVATGQLAGIAAIAQSVAFHAVFALAGAGLVGEAARRSKATSVGLGSPAGVDAPRA